MRAPIILAAFLFLIAPAGAQQVYKGFGTSNSTFLLGNNTARRTQCLYLPSDLIGPQAGLITRLYYRYGTTGQTAGVTLGNIVIAMRLTARRPSPTATCISPACNRYSKRGPW